MANKKVGARFSKSEYLEAGFDFVEGTGSVSIATPEGTENYEIGGGGTSAPIKIVDFILAGEDYITAKYNDTAYTYAMLDADITNGNVVIGNYNGAFRALGGQARGQGGYACLAFVKESSGLNYIDRSLGTNTDAVIAFTATQWNSRSESIG